MKTIIVIFLVLIALFTGGCSLLFFFNGLANKNDVYVGLYNIYPILITGFVIAAGAVLALVLLRQLTRDHAAGRPLPRVKRFLLTATVTASLLAAGLGLFGMIFGGLGLSAILAVAIAGFAGLKIHRLFAP